MGKKKGFEEYLGEMGAEVMPLTNEYELHRFVANEIVCVVYQGKRGVSFSGAEASKVYENYTKGIKSSLDKTNRSRFISKYKEKLISRDGLNCFYTGVTMTAENASIEHLIPVSKGGKNNMSNLVLCTSEINKEMDDKPLIEKLKIRDELLRKVGA